MSAQDIRRALARIAHQILERNDGAEHIALIGIETRGVYIAHRLAAATEGVEGVHIEVGVLDPRLYRDDPDVAGLHPVRPTEIDFDIAGRPVILVDDVLFTGRTIRAAIDALIDFGRPGSIQLAILVDRGHRELPIRADYVGKNVPTARTESVRVQLREIDETDSVMLLKNSAGSAPGTRYPYEGRSS
jgi:pyrimidine operon attenuation protein/uracil phosphoribosyltransferase